MRPNLALKTTPTVTSPNHRFVIPNAAAYGLVMSLSVASTASYTDLYKDITLQPITIASRDNASYALQLTPSSAVTPAANWLETTINEIHAGISDDAWAKVPPIHADDIDRQVYKI